MDHSFKAQNAMEYLMTYSWAILIVVVVLAALFTLGVFSGGSILGNTCIVSQGFACSGPILGTNGNVAFTFGQSTGTTVYNVGLSCAAAATSTGLLPNPPTSLVYLTSSGAATSNVAAPPNLGYLSLQSGQTVYVTGLQCFVASGTALATTGVKAAGTAYSGSLWVNYTLGAGPPGGTNPVITTQFATLTAKVA